MKKIAYARVSSNEQANNSNALDQQIERLQAAGATEIYSDVESGWKRSDRKNLEKVMDLVRTRQVYEVIVTRLDRLSRQGLKSFQIFEEFLNANVILRALDEPFDLTTAAGRAMARQLVVFAQFHSDQKAESVAHGWEHLRSRKVAVNPPFGYLKFEDHHQLDYRPFLCLTDGQKEMSKAAIAREIVEAFLAKKTLRLGLREINERYGIQTFAHNDTDGKRLSGRVAHDLFRFSPSGLHNWLTNPVLQGHLPYLRKDVDRSQVHFDTHPEQRLISNAEAAEIKSILSHNKQVRGYGTTAQKYPCSGLVFCGECRSACYSLSGARNYQKAKRLGIKPELNYYFQCKNWRLRACTNKSVVRMELVEDAVIEALISRAKILAKISQSPIVAEQDSPEIKQLELQILSLKLIPGNNPAIKAAISETENQIIQLRSSLNNTSCAEEIGSVTRMSLVNTFLDSKIWKSLDNEEKKGLYKKLINKVEVNNGKVFAVSLKI